MSTSKIAIIGAGNVGGALGRRLASSGYEVKFGLRDIAKAPQVLDGAASSASAGSLDEAARFADVIFLAVPAAVAVATARSLGTLDGKILVDCTNPIRWEAGPVWAPPPEGSVSIALAQACPRARIIKGFNGFGAEFHAEPAIGDTAVDVFLAGDDADAKSTVSTIAKRSGFSPIDAGPLRNASVLENVAILWIHLALVGGHGRNIAFELLRR